MPPTSDDSRTTDLNRLADQIQELRREISEHTLEQVQRITRQETRTDAHEATLEKIAATVAKGFDDIRRELRREQEDVVSRVDDHEARLKTLEASAHESKGRRALLAGAAATGGAIVGALLKALVEAIAKAM